MKPNLMEMGMGGEGAACLCGGAAGPDSASSSAAFSLPASLRQSYVQPLPVSPAWEQSPPLSAKQHNTPIQPTWQQQQQQRGPNKDVGQFGSPS